MASKSVSTNAAQLVSLWLLLHSSFMPLPRNFHLFFLSFILALIITTLWTKDFGRSRFLGLRIVLISDNQLLLMFDHQPVRCITKSTNSSFISDWNWPQVMVIDADWKSYSNLIIRACGIEKRLVAQDATWWSHVYFIQSGCIQLSVGNAVWQKMSSYPVTRFHQG